MKKSSFRRRQNLVRTGERLPLPRERVTSADRPRTRAVSIHIHRDWGLSSVEQNDSGDQLNRGEKISGEFVIAGRNGAKVLNLVEEALDEVAFAVECEIAIALGLSVGFGGNYRRDLPLCEALDERISVVGFVCDQGLRIGVFNPAHKPNRGSALP